MKLPLPAATARAGAAQARIDTALPVDLATPVRPTITPLTSSGCAAPQIHLRGGL